MRSSRDPEYARWLERNASASVFLYAAFISTLIPGFHWVLYRLPGVPAGSDSLELRCAGAVLALATAAALLIHRPLRRYAVAFQTFNALVAVIIIAALVVNSGDHDAYVASGLLVIVAAQQAFLRAVDLVAVFALGWIFQAAYSAWLGIFFTPMNLTALGIFAAGYILAGVPAALRIRIQGRELRIRLEAQRVKAQLQTVQDALVRLAQFDALTGLPNRATLAGSLDDAIAVARRNGSHVAVVFLDLDRFKDVNDSLGHEVGDRLLRVVAARFEELLPVGAMLSRWGGDEFVAVFPALRDAAPVEALTRRFVDAVAGTIHVDGLELALTVSAGIAIFPQHGEDGGVLIRNADTAMYEAKRELRSSYAFFTEALHDAAEHRRRITHQLRRAIADGCMTLYYQPLVAAASGVVVGAEALVRWVEADGTVRLPGDFIPVAEESGLIVELGTWVLRAACEQVARWQRRGLAIDVAVNVSARQFTNGDFVGLVRRVLDETGADPLRLQFEITEAALMSSAGTVNDALRELRTLGIRIAIDDFGTGYSSLAYLNRFQIDHLKIDRLFVQEIDRSASRAIARAIIEVAHALGVTVTAEGVETAHQYDVVAALGCDQLQGYHLGYPLPVERFEAAFVPAVAS